jgi:trehalose 6-phosphate synthase
MGRKNRLVLLSNREPYIHEKTRKGVKYTKPVGGLVAALDPVMQSCQGTWVAWGSGNADREVCDSQDRLKVPEEHPTYTLKRIFLTKREVGNYYRGFCNRVLWPISHLFPEKAQFKEDYWKAYKSVNNTFAEAALEEIQVGDKVWVHDFHLTMVPQLLKEKREDISIAYFWHIPFPPWEVFNSIPWRREILKGLLGCDLIGFHIPSYVDNFLDAVKKEFSAEVTREKGIERTGQITKVKALPLGINYKNYRALATSKTTNENAAKLRKKLRAGWVIFGVDRLDYSKGILKRLQAFERFLVKNPRYKGSVVFVQVAAPSRTKVQEYRLMKREIDETVGRINGRFQMPHWTPIIYIYRYVPTDRLAIFYKASDVAMVTPLIDGMNLVAKEYITVKDDGVLILSEFAGSSQELYDALLVNPHDINKTANAISNALEMTKDERIKRVSTMREKVRQHDINWWLKQFSVEWGVELTPAVTG